MARTYFPFAKHSFAYSYLYCTLSLLYTWLNSCAQLESSKAAVEMMSSGFFIIFVLVFELQKYTYFAYLQSLKSYF